MFTRDVFIQKFFELTNSEQKQIRNEANEYINQFQKAREAWSVARELIFTCQNQKEIQFIGASILSKKIKSEFSTLNEEQKIELRDFIFQTLNDTQIIISSQTAKQLCICAAIMGLFQICTTWPTLIEDLIAFMKISQRNIIYGLDILESIASEMSDIVQDRKFYLRTKSQLHEKQDQIYDIFNSLLLINNEIITINCLNCIYSWTDVNVKLQILNNNELIKNCLILIDEEQYNIKISQILQESISSSNFADILQTSQQIKEISENEIKNIKFILEKLFSKTQLLENGSFEKCKHYTELVTQIAVKFPIFILEKSEHSFALLKLLLFCSSHYNRKISIITFDFWKSFKQNLKDFYQDIHSSEHDCLLEPYLELLKIFIEKCRYNKLTVRKKQQNYQLILKKQKSINNEEESLDNFELSDNDDSNMTISDYRNYASDVISEIYQTFTQFRGNLGQDLFFNQIFQLLNHQNFDNEQLFHCSIDVAFYIIRSIMDLIIIDKQSNIYINKILNFILSNELPFQPALLISAIQILYDGVQELKVSPELQTPTIKLLLSLVHNEELGRLAATTLKEIIEIKGIMIKNFQFLSEEFAIQFQIINDEICLDNLIQAVFQCAIQLETYESQQRALQDLLLTIETRVSFLIKENNNNNNNNYKQIIGLFISLMTGFLQIQDDSKSLVTSLSSQFVEKYMTYLSQIFEEYGPINQEMMLRFLKLFKLIIKTCDDLLPTNFILFFETSLKILQIDPIKNVQALSIFQTLLESLGNDNLIFTQWMNQNFIDFNNYMLVIFENPQYSDPDLIRYYILILNKTLQFNAFIFFQCPNYENIMNLVLKSFLTINEFDMSKQILRFFSAFIKCANEQVLKCLPFIINSIMIRITEINKSLTHNAATIFIDVCQIFKDQIMYVQQILIDSLKEKKYEILNANQKKILTEAIIHYSCQNNLKDLRMVISDFCNLVNGTLTQNDMFFQLEIKITGEKRSRKNGISLQNNQ